MQPRHTRYIIITFISIIAIGLIASITTGHTSGDFDVYYNASRDYLTRAPIYIAHAGIEEFKYSPLFALLFSVLTIFGKTPALYLWGILNIFLLYLMFYFLFKLTRVSFTRIKTFVLIFCLFALTGRYIFSSIKIGQANFLLCFLMVLVMYFEINKKDFWAALCLALSLMIKFFPLLFLVYFVLRRRFKIAGLTILMAVFFLLLPSVYTGASLNFKYLEEWFSLLRTTPAPMFYSVKNFSLFAYFSWLFVASREQFFIFDYRYLHKGLTPAVYYAWAATCFVFFSAFFYDAFFKKERNREIAYLDYACLFTCGLLFNPLSYLNALVFLIVPYFVIVRFLLYSGPDRKWITLSGLLTLSCFVLTMSYNKCFFPDRFQFYVFLEYRSPMWVMLIIYLNLWLIKSAIKSRLVKEPVYAYAS